MAECKECSYFFSIPKDADDYEAEKGDCVTAHKDEKGRFWTSKPVFEKDEQCEMFGKS